jgi:hypothetical protein
VRFRHDIKHLEAKLPSVLLPFSARRGVYVDFHTGLFLCISLDMEDGELSNYFAMARMEYFCHSISCIFSLFSTLKCLYFIHFDYIKVLHLLVEPRPELLDKISARVYNTNR